MYSYGHGQIISEKQSYLVDTDGIGLEVIIQRVSSAQLDPISLLLQLKTQRLPIFMPSLIVLSVLVLSVNYMFRQYGLAS